MLITKHAKLRVLQRVKPRRFRKSVDEIAADAWNYGTTFRQTSGKLRSYMRRIFTAKKTADNTRLFLGHTWVFCGETLVTVWKTPEFSRKSWRCERRKAKMECKRFLMAA